MANCLFLHPNLSDARKGPTPGAVLSGGRWQTPLANVQQRRLSKVARSASAHPADTQFNVVFDTFGEIRAIVLVNHNLSVVARLRITAWYDEGSYFEHAYQAEFDAYADVGFTEDLPFEQENWWDRKPLARDIEGLTQNVVHVLPEPIYAPHWRIEIFDEGNPKGYVQFGRLWMATGWQPSQNMEKGPTLRYEDETEFETSLSGAEFPSKRPVFRVWNMGFRLLPMKEALDRGLDMMRRAGKHGELFYIHDPADARNLQKMSFLARFRELKDYELVNFSMASIAFEMKELL